MFCCVTQVPQDWLLFCFATVHLILHAAMRFLANYFADEDITEYRSLHTTTAGVPATVSGILDTIRPFYFIRLYIDFKLYYNIPRAQ